MIELVHPLDGLTPGLVEIHTVRQEPGFPETGMFGWTRTGGDGKPKQHGGIDWVCQVGQPILAAHPGIVQTARNDALTSKAYGLWVRLADVEARIATVYAHLSGLGVGIKVGKRVARGQLIGFAGRTGNVLPKSKTHLHHETASGNVHDWDAFRASRINPLFFYYGDRGGPRDGKRKPVMRRRRDT